jgi:thiol reductant ABC exporter CydC subunit
MKNYWRQLALAAMLSGLSLVAAVGLLASSAWLISMASTRPPILVLEVAIVGVRFFGLSRGVVKYASRIIEHDAALKIQTFLRIRIYENLANLAPNAFTKLKRGNLLSQIVGDIEVAQDLWIRIASPWISALIAGVSGIGIIYWLSPHAGNAIALLFVIAMAVVPFLATLSSSGKDSREHEAQLFSQVVQVAESSPEALIFNYSDVLIENLELEEDSIAYIESKSSAQAGLASSAHFLFLGLATFAALYFAATESLTHQLAGVNIAVVSLLPLVIFEGIGALPAAFSNLFQASGAAKSIRELAKDVDFEIENIKHPLATDVRLEFLDVVPVIDGVQLPHFSAIINEGETLVLSGRSGIGKSSITNSLLGFLPYTGEIRINGEAISSKHNSLFSVLLQDDYLFTTSIRENLKIGNPKASDRELHQILEVVELAELINKLPEGLDTRIGPLGYNFSGGEKQRLKLARVLLRNTPVFILDEPYEFLDAHQVDRIAKKVSRVLHGKTVLIISHLALPIEAKQLELAIN